MRVTLVCVSNDVAHGVVDNITVYKIMKSTVWGNRWRAFTHPGNVFITDGDTLEDIRQYLEKGAPDLRRERPGWEEYALILAEAASTRSEDPWVQVGACVLRHDKSVVAVGYNGAPAGVEIDWTDRDGRRPFVIHAEDNALRYCHPGEVWLIAVTLSPCVDCLKVIKAYKAKKVVFREWYTTDPLCVKSTKAMAKKYDIDLIQIPRKKTLTSVGSCANLAPWKATRSKVSRSTNSKS